MSAVPNTSLPVTLSPPVALSPAMHLWIRDVVRETRQKLRDGSLLAPSNALSTSSTESSQINHRLSTMLASAWSTSTRRNYDGSVRRFAEYCAKHSWSLSNSKPADEITLCLYVHSLAGSHSGSYIRNEIGGIRAFHIINNLEFKDSQRLRYLLKAADNLQPPSRRRLPHLATSADMLRYLRESLDLSSPFDVCCFAAATCAFWGQARLGELLPITLDGDVSHLPTLADLRGPTTAAGSRILFIPKTKTTGNAGALIYLCRQAEEVDAVSSLEAHIALNRPDIGPLFSYRMNGNLQRLTKSRFLLRIRGILDSAGFGRISGYSFRIGGTTELLLNNVEPLVVQVMGRWSSDSFLRYWRSVEVLAPLHAELLESRKRIR